MESSVPPPPPDMELRNIIDKLAQFVARNGPDFESMTKNKQKNNPKFQFLFGGEFYHYYMYRVNSEQAVLRQQQQHFQPSYQQQQQQQQHPPHWNNHSGGGWGAPHQQPQPQQQQQRQQQPNYQPQPQDYQPPPQQAAYNNGPPPPSSVQGHRPRPLMDIPTFMPPQVDVKELKAEVEKLLERQKGLREQVSQSESNLAAQQTVTVEQTKLLGEEAIRKAKWERLEGLAEVTGVDLEEMETVFHPIIENCTKDSISGGKGWIFSKATTHDSCQLMAHYLAYRVTQESAPFTVKLHLVYLANDVLHHCVRKGAEELKNALEAVSVEMFSAGWTAAGAEEHLKNPRQAKFTKLIKLWEDKSVFSASTINKMKNPAESWRSYQECVKTDYADVVRAGTKEVVRTYDNYASQHQAFVSHAQKNIAELEKQVADLTAKIESAAEKKSSRWDANDQVNNGFNHQQAIPPAPPPPQGMPDLSRPPPGFPPPPATIPQQGMGAPQCQGPPTSAPTFDESSLVPSLPYYDLPAGLMVPMVNMEDSGYKPLNPKDIRLPPPTPPTERLMAALEQFYAPPSHDRPRDPEGFELLGLYEWSKEKSNAIKAKIDALDAGDRERSPTASPDPFGPDSDHEWPSSDKRPRPEEEEQQQEEGRRKKKRYRSRTPSPKLERRSRSRTRSRSRGSTPDRRPKRSGSYSPSPSPPSGYSMPSYLTRRSPSPGSRRRSKSPRRRRRRSSSPERSPTYAGFGTAPTQSAPASRIDSSNKGHQMLQKMGWSGSGGLGSNESGISEPIHGGEVREKSEMYRGVGSGTSGSDPFEAFRKNKAGTFYTRMKHKDQKN